jgi:hypothetical protein
VLRECPERLVPRVRRALLGRRVPLARRERLLLLRHQRSPGPATAVICRI